MTQDNDWIDQAAARIKHELLKFMHEDPTLSRHVMVMHQCVHTAYISKIIRAYADAKSEGK